MPDKDFGFILIPAAPLEAQLNPIIEKLAVDYDAVPFVPHVTVYAGPASGDVEVRAIANHMAQRFLPVELTFEKLGYTNLFYKTLFVQFRESTELPKIFEAVKAQCAHPSTYALNPHLSLIYQRLSIAEQMKLSQTLMVPKGIYRMDSWRVIETERVESCDTVRRWRTVYDSGLKT